MKKLNKITAIFTAVMVVYLSGFSVAQAAVFEWISGNGNTESSRSLTFKLISSYFKRGNTEPATDEIKQDKVIETIETELAEVVQEMVIAATAYSSTPDQTDDTPFITAKGTWVRDGIVAANFLPFGTKIKIPDIYGDKIFIVEDRMNRRYWHRIDIWFPDRQSALEFGIKNVRIQILES